VAKELEASAWTALVRVQPKHAGVLRAPCIVPKNVAMVRGSLPWRKHWTTHVERHCVDALTGSDGAAASAYLAEHWLYSDVLELVADPLGEEPTDG